MNVRPAAHLGMGGPLDALIELGLPLVLFAALWWWSSRAERRRKRDQKDRPRSEIHERDGGAP